MQNRHLLSCRWWKDVHSCSAAALASDATAYQLPAVRVVRSPRHVRFSCYITKSGTRSSSLWGLA